MARHLLAYTRKLFRWAIAQQEYGLEHSPCEMIGASEILGPLVPRARVLTDKELKAVWDGSAALPDPGGPFVRLLIATGQRLREVANMSWAEVDLNNALWVVPAARMKSGKAHEVPLSSTALEILRAVTRFDDGPFVFTTTSGRRPISGFGKIKMRLDDSVAEIVGKPVPAWRFHDLRRTMRTHIGGLPVPSDVAEMVIGHRPGGVRGTYDLHAYRTEKRRALELWAVRLKELITPASAGTVARLREVAR
jgi:integrase